MWKPTLDQATSRYIGEAPSPTANKPAVRSHPVYGKLFDVEVPHQVEGFSLDSKERETITSCWPAGEDAAREVRMRSCLKI